MRIRLLRSVHSTSGALDEGAVHDLPESEAQELIGLGCAVPAPAAVAPEAASTPPVAEQATTKPARARRSGMGATI